MNQQETSSFLAQSLPSHLPWCLWPFKIIVLLLVLDILFDNFFLHLSCKSYISLILIFALVLSSMLGRTWTNIKGVSGFLLGTTWRVATCRLSSKFIVDKLLRDVLAHKAFKVIPRTIVYQFVCLWAVELNWSFVPNLPYKVL